VELNIYYYQLVYEKFALKVLKELTLSELMRLLQDLGTLVVIILLAYVVYKIAILIEVMSDRIKGERK
jgi:hypothetical protein